MPDTAPRIDDTTIFVTTIGDQPNFTDCMAHLHTQSIRAPIEIIDRVAPMSAAFQEMQRRCRTSYYVQVDEDMILHPHAIETLRNCMLAAPGSVAMICAPLWDCDAELPIYGIKIYRASILQQFPYQNTLSCEIDQLARIRAAGYDVILQSLRDRSICLGEHGKHYTPSTIFKRWQRCFQKHHRFGNMTWIEPYAHRLLERYVETGGTLHLYAFLGAVAGITGSLPADREVDWRELNPALEQLRRYFPERD
jgi:hypothetical protein